MSPKNALLSMLIVPIIFAFTYWFILTPAPSVFRASIFKPNTWIVPKQITQKIEIKNKKPAKGFTTVESQYNKFESFASSLSSTTNSNRKAYRLYYIPVFLIFL